MAMLAAEAARASPREACGLLLGAIGGGGRVVAAFPCANVAPDPARHFEIDPAALIAAHRAARADGPPLLGYYHSHPTGRAEPSPTDRAMASGDGRIWAIVGADSTGWFRDEPEGFTALPTRLVEG